jgi:flavin reductase (DIM6/NTAB) family NADH-FMN oxidoreductase RutF
MGHFATGVTIVTTAHAGTVRGMTANSVCSVSLEPLSVLVCVNHEALTYNILEAGQVFCVNVLAEDQEALSRACARPDTPEATLTGVSYRIGDTGAPILDGALAHLDCKVSASMDFGTHRIFVGEVVDIGSSDGRPLLFYRGKYLRAPEVLPA